MASFANSLKTTADSVNEVLRRLLPDPEGPEARLLEAMSYSTLAGGKRLRAFLVTASADMFGVGRTSSLRVASAVEMIHTYSLVHDDLPCMDDDDVRRGEPALHIAFNEATAVLAGDALQARAFEILVGCETHPDPTVRCELVRSLAAACGCRGMVGGQMIDLEAEHENIQANDIIRLQQLKTGALIAFSCEAGAILGKVAKPLRQALHQYAHDLGLAFQIIDDLLDAEGDGSTLGKPVRKDSRRGKATLVSALGPERARTQARMLAQQASAHLDPFGEKADIMRAAAEFVISRDR